MSELSEFKFVTTLVLKFKKIKSKKKKKKNRKYNTFYSHSKSETIINESDIDKVLESIYNTIISNIQESLRKDSDWFIDSVIEHNLSISK